MWLRVSETGTVRHHQHCCSGPLSFRPLTDHLRVVAAAYPQPEVDRICAAGLLLPIPEPPEVFDPNIHVHDLASFMGNVKNAVQPSHPHCLIPSAKL